MQRIKEFVMKYGTTISAFALFVAISSANSACFIFYHQPKVPAALNQYKK